MEAVVRSDLEPLRHSDCSKSEDFREESSDKTSEIMTQSHSRTSKSSRSSTDDASEDDPFKTPKSPQTRPPKPQEMCSDDDDADYVLSGPLFELPEDMLQFQSFSLEPLKSPPPEWSMASGESLFSIPIGNRSFSRDWYNKQGETKSSENVENIPRKSLRVQWSEHSVKTYSFNPEIQDNSQPSAISKEKSSSSESSYDCSFCAFFSSCETSSLNCWGMRPSCSCCCCCCK